MHHTGERLAIELTRATYFGVVLLFVAVCG